VDGKNPAPVGRSFSLFLGFQHVSTIINHHQPSSTIPGGAGILPSTES